MGALKLEDINYTYDDYKIWQDDWELISGVPLAMSPAPMRKHQSTISSSILMISWQKSISSTVKSTTNKAILRTKVTALMRLHVESAWTLIKCLKDLEDEP